MELAAILKELHDERESVEAAIFSLERLAAGQGKRRGRPPGWMKQLEKVTDTPKRKRGRPPKSKETQ